MRGREVQEKFYRLGNNVHLGEQLSTMVTLPRDLILRFISLILQAPSLFVVSRF